MTKVYWCILENTTHVLQWPTTIWTPITKSRAHYLICIRYIITPQHKYDFIFELDPTVDFKTTFGK